LFCLSLSSLCHTHHTQQSQHCYSNCTTASSVPAKGAPKNKKQINEKRVIVNREKEDKNPIFI